MNFTIREMKPSEYCELENFLYEMLHAPIGGERPSREILKRQELQVYVENFGAQSDDYCLAVELDGELVGACWTRIMNDYAHIDDETPSLVIALKRGFRGQGIGTALLKAMFKHLTEKNFKQVSLSVQKSNSAARKLYERLGFKIVGEVQGDTELEDVMILKLEG